MGLLASQMQKLCFVGPWLLKNVFVDVVTLPNVDVGGFENSCQKLLVEKNQKVRVFDIFSSVE